jgi:hypothetical protein
MSVPGFLFSSSRKNKELFSPESGDVDEKP